MTCETVRAAMSLRLDGERGDPDEVAPEDLERHLERCVSCRAFDERSRRIRTQLRYEALDEIPDVAPGVRDSIAALPPSRSERTRPNGQVRILAVAAAFAVGVLIGAALVTDDGTAPGPVAAADIPARVAAAQFEVDALSARLEVIERGWHADVPQRRWTGTLAWSAPERLELQLEDDTSYPSPDWVPDDVTLIVDEDRSWTSGPRDCPPDQQPACTVAAPRVELVTGREPFADGASVPLDLVVPVRSFAGANQPTELGQGSIAGRRTVGVRTTAAQVQPVIDGLRPAGNLREVHPADPVDLWLDAETMVPLALEVVAGVAPDRITWAANRGYHDEPGDVVVSMNVTAIDYDPPPLTVDGPHPGATTERAAGFTDGPTPILGEIAPPEGFALHRAGQVAAGGPVVEVIAWTDGRGWVKVRATSEWSGTSLFGDLGGVVRMVELTGSGVAYLNDRGDRVAMHTDDVDLVVTGSVGEDRLRRIAAGIGLTGQPVPADWVEAASASADDAAAVVPGLLLPDQLDGFGTPSVRADGSTVVVSYAGPGARGFQLTEASGNRLTPPLDLSVTAVDVRGEMGRWSGSRGELEWTEGGVVVSLRSVTLSLDELLAIAASMEPA